METAWNGAICKSQNDHLVTLSCKLDTMMVMNHTRRVNENARKHRKEIIIGLVGNN